jgi:hypothetical protein
MAEDTALTNPATVYCLSRGGVFNMKKTLAGTTEGYCQLENGVECEVWAMYKGECADTEEPKEENQDDNTSSSTEAGITATSTSSESAIIDDQNESESNSAASDDPPIKQDGEKKKALGEIDIAVKPGLEKGEIIMSWDTHDLQAPSGYIVMLATTENIAYPAQFSHELNREESYSFTWVDLNPEKEYYFRVCIKSGDACGTYSPVIGTYPKTDASE